MADTRQIADELVALCREGRNADVIDQLYSKDIVSVEAAEGDGFPREMKGAEAVRGKNKWWAENHEVHSAEVLGPYMHGDDRFAVQFKYDVTSKPMSQRIQMDEIGVYTVADGKISREEFFYTM